ncbi:hypothetical protein AB7C87_11275 [Natrarchaeobius sp. A-rgal3]|uniref:hypothetical protein n=1 Tax=Natrarchaeobius versutus TaxID=1679078 RepID=UPI0035104936
MTGDRSIAVTLENRLMSHGIYVLEADWNDPDSETERGDGRSIDTDPGPRDGHELRLEYEVVTDVPQVTSDEVGTVVRTVLEIADERGWSPGRLEITSRRTDGSFRGRWHVEREWFDGLHAEYSEGEFSRRVLETVTTGSIDE